MPVPPPESAPFLSPRQSFGCQSPLPWVTGTDRTGILWALWQLQGFLPGVLFFLCALSHLEELLTGQQASRSPVLRSHNNPQETQTQVSPNRFNSHWMISQQSFRNRDFTHRLTRLSRTTRFLPEILTGFSRAGKYSHRLSQKQTQTPRLPTEVVHGFPPANTANGFRDESGYSAEIVPVPRTGFSSEWRRETILGSVQRFYFHAPGLTLVTLGTACIPSVRLLPTTWKLTGPSKGLRIK
jgi:hypothetical protein